MDKKHGDRCQKSVTGTSKSCNTSALAVLELSPCLEPVVSISRARKERHLKFWHESVAKTKLKELKESVDPEYSKIVKKVNYHDRLYECAYHLPTAPNTKYVDRAVLSRVCARGLENVFVDVLWALVEDARQLYVDVSHQVGVICIINPPNEFVEGHVILEPLKFLGKTQYRKNFLNNIRMLENRLFITFPLIREVLCSCVIDLPECLIDFTCFRDRTYTLSELRELFDEEIQKAHAIMGLWYRSVANYVRLDTTYVPTESLEFEYYSCITGLLSVYVSHCLRKTAEHILEITSNKQKLPQLKMELDYFEDISVVPTCSNVTEVYVSLIAKIIKLGNNLMAVESLCFDKYLDRLVSIFISPELQEYYELQLRRNIAELYVPVNEYVKQLNEEYTELYAEKEKWMKIEQRKSSDTLEYRETIYRSFDAETSVSVGNVELITPISENLTLDERRQLDTIFAVTEPTEPTESTEPTEPREPMKPIELIEPIEPLEPIKPMEPKIPSRKYILSRATSCIITEMDKGEEEIVAVENDRFPNIDITYEEGYEKVDCYRKFKDKLSMMVDFEYFPLGMLSQAVCRDGICKVLAYMIEKVASKLVAQHMWMNEDICEQFEMLKVRALTVPQTSDELMEMGAYMLWASTDLLTTLKERTECSLNVITRLVEMTTLTQEHFDLNSRTVLWVEEIKTILEINTSMFEQCKFEFEERLQKTIEKLCNSIASSDVCLEFLDNMDDADQAVQYVNDLGGLLAKIREFDKIQNWINKEETTFKFPLSSFTELTELKNFFYPFVHLIFVCRNWKRKFAAWMNGPFEFLDFTAAEIYVEETTKELIKTQKTYKAKIRQAQSENHPRKFKGIIDDPDLMNQPAPIKLCVKALQQIKDFRPCLNLMVIMCNDALLQRHWDDMSEIAGFDLTPHAGTTLKKLMKMGLDVDIDKYEIISSGAVKERQLLQNLLKMQAECEGVLFKTRVYKDTSIQILTQLDDIQVILDDQIIKTLTMRGSVFVKPYEIQVRAWYEKITRMNATLDEWGKVQAQWLYLLPIFSSKDIVSQMPEEGMLFKQVDEVYRRYMGVVQQKPKAIETAGSVGFLENLQNCTKLLEKINEGVAAYLERKRLYFPRFFFLSNDEMLEILSETKDPLRVQSHLRKCFEGINKLQFDEILQIHAMFSEEGEKINFLQIINTENAHGSVEKWLIQVESQMLASVRDQIFNSWKDYKVNKRLSWVQLWPGQVVLAVSQIFWTTNVHVALSFATPNAVGELSDRLKADLQDIVALVRSHDISNLSRITIKALIVIDVHAKDVVRELFDKQVKNDIEFTWLAQLRYYWKNDCMVRILNATVRYAYEYLGNSDRLVITPLTDRCFRTLVGAYHLHLNGAPEGPAGTGKTETTKDLAKALAVQCVVFNCSDGLDYKAMGKFFKGLASAGAWACFDEFNRIKIEVLSVLAQQILCILLAVRAHAVKFMFEGTELTLNPACYVCITMNPGYAGRFELPDNLKVLFRTVVMMVPDSAMISEVSLYSYGFKDARKLSVKIFTVYRLCSEQLSSQSHYDYGMRAVKSVLSACGNNKRKFPNEDEDILLLRSILHVNLPKFLNNDVPLFNGIISDLFPGVVLPPADYDVLIEAMKESCEKRQLQLKECVITKVIQTYEMMIVRHGFMLVGEPFAGKTSTLKVLADALTILNKQGHPQLQVQYQFINPKAVTMGQLYGQFDPVSYEWFDGVVATCFRRFVTDPVPDRKWVIFDGPVDAVWIENMNTVLDDNKKLCLMSGEVMAMTNAMSMIFEVMDLTQASPATVSRCGMIYMEPTTLGWKPHVDSWIVTCSAEWCEPNQTLVLDLFAWLVPPSLYFIRKYCRQLCNSGQINLVKSMMNIVDITLTDACNEREEDFKHLPGWIQATFMYAGVWGLGGILDTDSREKFDEFYKTMWRGLDNNNPYPSSLEKLEVQIPSEGHLSDYTYVYRGKGNWKSWLETVRTMRVDETANIQQALIPTIDTAKYMHIVEMHIQHRISVLLVGPTGTGKSFYMQDLLMNKLDQEKYEPAFVTFTVKISANQTQDIIISKLNKRKRGHYGPPKGKTCVIFVDDLNMPVTEIYGAQPPIELLRQYFDHMNWYDLKDTSAVYLHDILLTAAMGPPGGSRQEICARFLRHFSVFSINEFSEESMSKIYTNILLLGFKKNGFPSDVITNVQHIVAATLDIYQQTMMNLRPTPAKSHYVFNLRDFSRIIMGCSMLRKESAENKNMFSKIWVHEVLRVIYDRLVDVNDKKWLYNKLKASVKDFFKDNFDMVFESLGPNEEGKITEEAMQKLMFGSYLNLDASEEEQKYEEITNVKAFFDIAMNCLDEYNATHKNKMDVVLFKYALDHLSKICRVLSMPSGSALLVGISGSGRQSLTKLATTITKYSLFQPEITTKYGMNEWRDDIKQVVKEAGGRGKNTVLLLTETQIKQEGFLEDIDCLLNSGEVPNIFQLDEKQEVLELARLAAQGGNRNLDISALAVFSFFIKRTRERLHIILCFSPIGSSFRSRLRLYPSLINCCTIDWFEDWPEDALEKVAHNWMEDVNLSTEVKESAIKACKYFHVTARKVSAEFYIETARKSYVTSASYLGLIKSYTTLTNTRQEQIMNAKHRYMVGLQKFEFAATQISEMQKNLEAFQPELKTMSDKQTQMTRQIEKETIQVEEGSALVRRDEEVANEQAAEAQALKAECEADLAEAIPILEDAIAALNTLKPADITLVKSMKNPPDAIKLVMAAVCVIKDIKPDRLPDPSTGRKILDYWGPSKRILGDIGFLQSLKDFDKDHIRVDIMTKIRKEYLPHKDFKPDIVAKASSAAKGLCKWIIAMDMYDKVAKEVAPKKEKLEKAEKAYAATMAILLAKKEEVAKLEEKLAHLNVLLAEATKKQKALQARVNLCANKLVRAKKLIGGLGGEKSRWTAAANGLQGQYDCLGGDILISCAVIAYLSPFTIQWRLEAIADWLKHVQKLYIPVTPTYDFTVTLASEIKIQNWYIAGLPRDAFSTANAIIQDNSTRWSLLVDPQSQANLWIKKMETLNEIKVTKFSDGDYMRILEKCIESGKPALIENIAEELEAPLDPLLLKATFEQAGILVVALGDNLIAYNNNFRLYLTSKLRNPHYLPDVFNKVTIVNFALTFEGLEDQLLGIVVAKERPDLQRKREELIIDSAANNTALADVEEMILRTLSETKGDILEDESAIRVLNHSKLLSIDIIKKQAAAVKTEEEIEAFRMDYKPVATHSAGLYYCISDLPNVDPMYQYSLRWFINLYISSIQQANQSRKLDVRLDFLKDGFTYNLYANVCRSLFEKDKLMFSFLLCVKIMLYQHLVNEREFNFLLTGGIDVENHIPNPCINWLTAKSWNEICRLDQLPSFRGIQESFTQNDFKWKAVYDKTEPQNHPFPPPWQDKLEPFQTLLVIRALRPDKITVSISQFVDNKMGKRYIVPPPFDIAKSFQESSCICPLVFILSAGTDPMGALIKFTEVNNFGDKFRYISVGQGQGPIAQALIEQAQNEGSWVCLQNCHLAASWMQALETICENLDVSNTHMNFRLWLTSCPSDKFPVSILQNGVKMTNETPTGLQQNLLRSYLNEPLKNPEFYSGCPGKELMFTRLLYGIAFFHAVVQERRSFGSLGWNIPYAFNESDFDISVQQLQMFINEFADNLYEGIRYLTGECNYGGRVTDDWDRRLIITILQDYLNPQMVSDMNYTFTDVGSGYDIPRKPEYKEYMAHINKLPRIHPPEVFGLHQNAGITRDIRISNLLLNSIILVQGEASAKRGEDALLDLVAGDILTKLPVSFDLEAARNKFPLVYSESMNTILLQEMERFTKLLNEIRSSLHTMRKAIEGFVVMTPALELLASSLLLGRIPATWAKVSYPSLKSLPNYIADFLERILFLESWFHFGKPNTFWLSGFFSPQAFLTGAKQNFARKYTIPIDQLTFDFEILKVIRTEETVADGVYCYGLYTDGARWDIDKGVLRELVPKLLFDVMPVVWLKPITNAEYDPKGRYLAPLYKTSERRGILSTTGHSTNYVLPLLLETDVPAAHWIKRGVALLCQLD